jgi:hypothetical protein
MSTFLSGKRTFKKISHSYSTFAGFGGRYLAIFGIRGVESREQPSLTPSIPRGFNMGDHPKPKDPIPPNLISTTR